MPDDSPMTTRPLTVFLAEDHALVRAGLRHIINTQPDLRVSGESDNGPMTLERLRELQESEQLPDVLVLDVSMPDGNGLEAAVQIRRQWPDLPILVLTMHEERAYLRRFLQMGVSGYLVKRSVAAQFLHAIRLVAEGSTFIDPLLVAKLVKVGRPRSVPSPVDRETGPEGARVQGGTAPFAPAASAPGKHLSAREKQILILIAEGFTNKQIGSHLGISEKTVASYKARFRQKLSLETRAEIVRYAWQQGWAPGQTR